MLLTHLKTLILEPRCLKKALRCVIRLSPHLHTLTWFFFTQIVHTAEMHDGDCSIALFMDFSYKENFFVILPRKYSLFFKKMFLK